MVNMSINWASLFGLILLAWSPLLALAGVEVLSRRGKSKLLLLLIIGRYVCGLLCAGILFFQGWKLDPIMQFGLMLLALGLVAESSYGLSRDNFSFRSERKRYKSVYAWGRTNQVPVPTKSIFQWYLISLAGLCLPFAGGVLVLLLAWMRFSKVEKRLLELQQLFTV